MKIKKGTNEGERVGAGVGVGVGEGGLLVGCE